MLHAGWLKGRENPRVGGSSVRSAIVPVLFRMVLMGNRGLVPGENVPGVLAGFLCAGWLREGLCAVINKVRAAVGMDQGEIPHHDHF
jgi:hypothetical protein